MLGHAGLNVLVGFPVAVLHDLQAFVVDLLADSVSSGTGSLVFQILELARDELLNCVVGSAHDGADSGNERCGLSDSTEANLESLAEIIPEAKFLELSFLPCGHIFVGRSGNPSRRELLEIVELSVLDTVVDGSRHLSELVGHLSVFRVRAHGVGNTAGNLGCGTHDGAESSLEVIPETELLKLFLGEVSPLGLELVTELLSSWYGFVLPHILHIIHGGSKFVLFPLGDLGSDLGLPGVLGVGNLVGSPLLGFLETLIHVGSSLLEGEELLRFDSVGKHSNN